jgi:putative two-component system response regulator
VYKSAMPHEVARGIIIQSSSTHFDPQVVRAFLAVENHFVETRKQFSD